ncbi:unnamed protein product [Closterium sp. NIES-65]|nr:unnamed protein product [Closterium sp. NIES-65]
MFPVSNTHFGCLRSCLSCTLTARLCLLPIPTVSSSHSLFPCLSPILFPPAHLCYTQFGCLSSRLMYARIREFGCLSSRLMYARIQEVLSKLPTLTSPRSLLLCPLLPPHPQHQFGCLSSRLMYARIQEVLSKQPGHTKPPVSLIGQLLWREFFYTAAYGTPNFDRMQGSSICRQIPWKADPELLVAWRDAKTGFPWIDAIMVQVTNSGGNWRRQNRVHAGSIMQGSSICRQIPWKVDTELLAACSASGGGCTIWRATASRASSLEAICWCIESWGEMYSTGSCWIGIGHQQRQLALALPSLTLLHSSQPLHPPHPCIDTVGALRAEPRCIRVRLLLPVLPHLLPHHPSGLDECDSLLCCGLVHWELGRDVFDRLLVDSDWAINNGNWLWLSASAFFSQYHRIYSPVTFGKKYDPSGKFIRHFLPVLKDMPSQYIYEPWTAPLAVQRKANCIIGKDYPRPIVDHAEASKRSTPSATTASSSAPSTASTATAAATTTAAATSAASAAAATTTTTTPSTTPAATPTPSAASTATSTAPSSSTRALAPLALARAASPTRAS